MNAYDNEKIKKELRLYAQTYRTIFSGSSKTAFMKYNQIMDAVLKGKWVSNHTKAKTYYIARPDGSQLRVLVVTKKNHTRHLCTGLLWLHGGGYALGLPEMDMGYANLFTEEDSCVMVLPDYRRSAEAPYPAAFDDAYMTLQWMKNHAAALDIKSDQLFVGGESAGGGLACAVVLKARDEKKINVAFQMPLYPMIDDRMTGSSSHNEMPTWNTKKNLSAWSMYRGGHEQTSKYFAPSRETDYQGLPPAFSIISDIEPFYDEVKKYFRCLYAAGNAIMLKEYKGCLHGFDIACPSTKIAAVARALEVKVFRYAQKNYFAVQPDSETVLEDIIQDIESQHAMLDKLKHEDEEDTAPVMEDTAEIAEQETIDIRPADETAEIAFPDFPGEEFNEKAFAFSQEELDESNVKVEPVREEAHKFVKEPELGPGDSFTRDDVLSILAHKTEVREYEEAAGNPSVPKDELEDTAALDNVQTLIANDTTDSLIAIDDLVEHL